MHRPQSISKAVDVNLSKNEDSVSSLAVAHSSESSATVFAGINSSSANQNAGRNEHLRSFRLAYPSKRTREGNSSEAEPEKIAIEKSETKALGKASLFQPSKADKKETYQRILRLSPLRKDGGIRLGAVATGLAPEGEIVLFDASKSSPSSTDICGRISLGPNDEAADVDIADNGDGTFQVAYCKVYDVFVCTVSISDSSKTTSPRHIYSGGPTNRKWPKNLWSRFRSIRFLTPSLLLLLQNFPNKNGAQLILLDISSTSELGTVILQKKLPESIKSGSALSTTLLRPLSPNSGVQHAVAIAGADISLHILALETPPSAPFGSLSFKPHKTLKRVHPLQTTALTFSTFYPPPDPTTAPPQYIKLASCSMDGHIKVHTLPLFPYPTPTTKSSRYVLRSPYGYRETLRTGLSVVSALIVVALGALLLQAFTEIRGGTPEYLGAKGWIGETGRRWIARPYMFDDMTTAEIRDSTKSQVPNMENVVGVGRGQVQEKMNKAIDSAKAGASKVQDKTPSIEDIVGVGRASVQEKMSEAVESAVSGAESVQKKLSLRKLLHHHRQADSQNPAKKAIIVRDEGKELKAGLHDEGKGEGKRWEDLSGVERERWKKRLVEAGEWTVDEGEAVLKGVFFGTLAAAVGAAVRAEL